MSRKKNRGKFAGTFEISPEHSVYGELKLNGARSRLKLHGFQFFPTHLISAGCVVGTLQDLTKVSLLGCVTSRAPGSSSGPSGEYYFANVVPHYIIRGDSFIRPDDEATSKVIFYIDDAKTLFFDFGAFGSVFMEVEDVVKQIIATEPYRQDRKTGPNARILYYTGRDEILNFETALGRLRVEHRPHHKEGNSGGSLRDDVAVILEFDVPLKFNEVIRRTGVIIDYLGMLVGRPQKVEGFYISTTSESAKGKLLEVNSAMDEGRKSKAPNGKPSFHEVLLDGINDPEQFSLVTANWIARQEMWRDARWRFFNAFAEERHYDLDRLVATANMFDILPASAVPQVILLTPEVEAARNVCKTTFRPLQMGPERSSLFESLDRLGRSSLRIKVEHRAKMILEKSPDSFPGILKVVSRAIKCRNFFVHGTAGDFDYYENFDMVVFFTDSLEFIFAMSDLIEAGWDFNSWMKLGSSMRHPFGRYKVNYRHYSQRLSGLIPSPLAEGDRSL